MEYALANNTSGTSNPGCQGTIDGLVAALALHGHTQISTIPFGYQYKLFKNCFESPEATRLSFPGQRRLTHALHVLIAGSAPTSSLASGKRKVERARWLGCVSQLEKRLGPCLEHADSLIINGEGTIHDDSIGALALLGLCHAAKRLGKQVQILNCSVFNLDPFLLEIVKESVDRMVVREPISQRYLKEQGVVSSLAPDCLFLANFDNIKALPAFLESTDRKRAIYTPGVLAGSRALLESVVSQDIRQLIGDGYEVIFYVVEIEDESLAGIAAREGAKVVPLGALSWRNVAAFLKTAEVVVSGRYHMNIFAIFADVPFLPLETNTPKMLGLLELIGADKSCSIRPWGSEEAPSGRLNLEAAISIERNLVRRLQRVAQDIFVSC